jgi:hypothetical protein
MWAMRVQADRFVVGKRASQPALYEYALVAR